MNQKKFDFSAPTGTVSLAVLALSLFAYTVSIFLFDIGVQGTNDWRIAAMWIFGIASIGLCIALVLLFLNFKASKRTKEVSDWMALKHSSVHVLPPLCQRCRYPARWAFEFDSWYCDKCHFITGPFWNYAIYQKIDRTELEHKCPGWREIHPVRGEEFIMKFAHIIASFFPKVYWPGNINN